MLLAVLNDKHNEAKDAFVKRLDETARVAACKAAGGLAYVDPSGPQPWKENANDPILGWESS